MARTAPFLPPGEGRAENLLFCEKKEQFPFPLGYQARGLTVSNALPPHSCPRYPLWPVAKKSQLGDATPRCPFDVTRTGCGLPYQPVSLAHLDSSTWLHNLVSQANCTHLWSLQGPRSVNLHSDIGKVTTLHRICLTRCGLSTFVVPQGYDGIQVEAFSIDP